ncbi:hypothetical protein [Rhodopila sp.]|uniref:hypothetical protein n=1 Tax=Rhodopila sp. TaxID=2480087 RepID=UPI003D1438DC
MIEHVVVVGDLLRPQGDGRPGGVDRPTLWLCNALKRSIQLASGLQPRALTTSDDPALGNCIRSSSSAADADANWAATYEGLPGLASLEQLLMARLQRCFCIGYEMPPWLKRLLSEHRVPFVDLRLGPVRFMDDLLFAALGSTLEMQAGLLSMAMQESEVHATAGLREAMCRLISEAAVPDNTLLVAGQRRFDSSQIVDGTFFDAFPRAAEIHRICAGYSAVVLKPHPLDRRHSLLEVVAGAPANVIGVIDDNAYRMMALPQISAVLTVNSGLAVEAGYFGKRVHTLAALPIRLAWRGDVADQERHVSLNDVVLTPDFWRLILAPYVPVTAADGMQLPPKPNRLRIALDSFWNYQQIDTDLIPRPNNTLAPAM